MIYSINPKTEISMYDHDKTARIVTSREDFKTAMNAFMADYPELCRLDLQEPSGRAHYTVAQNAILFTLAHPQLVDYMAAYL